MRITHVKKQAYCLLVRSRATLNGPRAIPPAPDFQRRARLIAAPLIVMSLFIWAGPTPSAANLDERNIEQYATRRVQPAYPPLAQKQRIEGVVVVQVSVAANGKVSNADFLRGNNVFRSVSLEAARRWEFRVPNGEALEGTIRFTFKLD